MAIQVGQQAPDFELYAQDKSAFKLSGHRGKNLLLLFYPGAFSSICTNELNMVNNDLTSYTDANIEVVGISTDSLFVQAEFKKAHALEFSLLSDHNAEVCEAYGTKYEAGEFPFGMHRVSRRSAFVIDTEGIVQYAEVLESAGDMPSFEAIGKVIENL